MAAIVGLPAGGSLVAATNYYQRCISSTSSTSSLISSPTGMTPLTEEAQHKAGVLGVVTNSQITCVSWEMVMLGDLRDGEEEGRHESSLPSVGTSGTVKTIS
uniref:Uncharacterized protein n=1 Tax=Haplochromis burtoni TaxID=8153 RepID=A0A3Q2WVN4_HAPBU